MIDAENCKFEVKPTTPANDVPLHDKAPGVIVMELATATVHDSSMVLEFYIFIEGESNKPIYLSFDGTCLPWIFYIRN